MSGPASATALFEATWDKRELRRTHPPRLSHPYKRLLDAIAFAPGEQECGEIHVSRWRVEKPRGRLAPECVKVRVQPGFFDYCPGPGVPPEFEWHMNFADRNLFFGYGGALFAQDEIQVAEHPLLASVRERLCAEARAGCSAAVASTRDPGGEPTPVLVRGALRRIAVSVHAEPAADWPHGLYGQRFGAAPRAAIERATRRLDPPVPSNILAIDAPACGQGHYSGATLADALASAHAGFRAVGEQSGAPQRVVLHTGNWGCGAFGGNPELMYLVQMLGAAWAGLGTLVFHAPDQAAFDSARAHFMELCEQHCDLDRALEFLAARRYAWGVSDGN